jgi:hypothetical protein
VHAKQGGRYLLRKGVTAAQSPAARRGPSIVVRSGKHPG